MKLLFLLFLGIMLNMSVVCGNISYQTKTVFVENLTPPVEKGKKVQKAKKLKKQPPKANSPRMGKVFMVIGIVFLSIVAVLGIVMLAFYLAAAASTVVLFIMLGILAVFLLFGTLYLILGLGMINRNKNWDIDYR